jgi:spermidine/putrescine-binding protein
VEKGENDSKYDWVSEFEKNNYCRVENIIFKNEQDISKVLQDGTADLVILSSELVLKYARDEKLRENWNPIHCPQTGRCSGCCSTCRP